MTNQPEDLYVRAGASDTDREAWLAQRRTGITATEVRDIAKGGAVKRKELIGYKLHPETNTFTGNQYTEWGKKREAALARVLEAAGITPETRIFQALENPRHMASPDGVGFDPIGCEWVLGEIKTSKYNLDPAGDRFAATGYYDQMQWQMYVCGATRCLFVWEQHDDAWPAPSPLPHRTAWVERDDERIAQLIVIADEFLAELDGAAVFSDYELRRIRVQAEAMEWHRRKAKDAEAKLRALIGSRAISESLDGKKFEQISVSYSGDKPKRVKRVNEEAAQAEHAAEYQALQAAEAAWQDVLAGYTVQEWAPGKGRLTVKGV